MKVHNSLPIFNFRALSSFHICDVMGYDPSSERLPLTPKAHCSNCGTVSTSRKSKSSNLQRSTKSDNSKCSVCNHKLKMKVDYGGLTDALVWAYVFRDVGIDIQCNNRGTTLSEIVSVLPLARCYQRIDELGHNFYKLQCYFLTHLVYVFSDWGQHALRRQFFAEEYEFVIHNMKIAISLNDPEIVGEFIQCLKIMQVTKESDPDVWGLIEIGYKYLIAKEQEKGGKGTFVHDRESIYDRYHSSYCASIGLLDYSFMLDDQIRLHPALPRMLKFLQEDSAHKP